jgi:hypothetical protein
MDTVTMWVGLVDEDGDELPIPRVQVQLIRTDDGRYGVEHEVVFGTSPISATIVGLSTFVTEFGGKREFETAFHPPHNVRTADSIIVNTIGSISPAVVAPFAQSTSFDEWMANNGDTPIDPKELWDAAFIAGSRFMHTLTERA